MRGVTEKTACRSIFISDLHLGSYRADAQGVVDFLSRYRTETLYLVGDVIDLWSLRRGAGWREQHMAVIRKLAELAGEGTRLVVIPGNHDGPLLHLAGLALPGLAVESEVTVETLRGERLLVTHGHQLDPVLGASNEFIGYWCGIGEQFGAAWRALMARAGLSARELRDWAEQPASRFERAWALAARELGVDGVICGHSHVPADRMIEDVRYLNCGDWMRNCTAIVEDENGAIELVRWRAAPVARRSIDDYWDDDAVPALAGE